MPIGKLARRFVFGLSIWLLGCSITTGCQAIKLKSFWIPPGPTHLSNLFHLDASNSNLANLLIEGQRIQNTPLHQGYRIERGRGFETLNTRFHGFSWDPSDFQKLVLIGYYGNKRLKTKQIRYGIGVPVVILRESKSSQSNKRKSTDVGRDEFLGPISAISATAVHSADGYTIDFYNPIMFHHIEFDGVTAPLSCDTTASIAYMLHHHPQTRYRDFIFPEQSTEQSRLTMLEPFDPNKIPLILVHGLLSSPDTYGELYNRLRTDPILMDDYQIWVFKYATGSPFIRTASDLRNELDRVIELYDPERTNQYLQSSMLVGHSMGGLITRLLISYSSEHVWNSVSRVPLEVLSADEKTKAEFAQRFYFDPHPLISKAVFIATPHRGSSTAGRALGKFASAIVVQSDTQIARLIDDNPGAIRDTLADGLPTSIDMLDPNQPFLKILGRLKISEHVTTHSIIGVGGPIMGLFQTDGLVPLESAKFQGVATERHIQTSHNGILKHPETALELQRILFDHSESFHKRFQNNPSSMQSGSE